VHQFVPVVVALVIVVLLGFQTRITARCDYQCAACGGDVQLDAVGCAVAPHRP